MKSDLALSAGEKRTDAEVNAKAKRNVPIWISSNVKSVWFPKLQRIPVCGANH